MVSIALAVYNGEKYLQRLLASLEAQTVKPSELVVVDDGSVDKSIEIIERFPLSFEKRIFINDRNSGAVSSFKKAVSLCAGSDIAFCDQDDIWVPAKLQLLSEKLVKLGDTKPAIVFSDLSVIDENDNVIEPSFWKQRKTRPANFFFIYVLLGNLVTGCTTLINSAMRDIFLQMPVKDVMMHDHWLALVGYSFGTHAFIEEPLVLFRSHEASVTDKKGTTYLSNFLVELRQKESYLSKNIKQAKTFKRTYNAHLSEKDLKALTRFINMENKSFWYKRLYRDVRSFLRRLK